MHKILSITILFTFLVQILPSNLNALLPSVCAEDVFRSGKSCITNYAICPTGSRNLLEMANTSGGRYSNRMSSDRLSSAILEQYGGTIVDPSIDSRSVCIKDGYTDFTIRWMPRSEYNASRLETLPYVDTFSTNFVAIPRVCPSGWRFQEARNTVFGADNILANTTIKLQGCCPSGFEFVNIVSDADELVQGGQALQAGVCCRGSGFDSWDPDASNGGCKRGGTVVIPNTSQFDATYSSFEQALSEMASNSSIIIGLEATASGWNTQVDNPSTPGNPKPQFGLGLGESYPGLAVVRKNGVGATTGSSRRCPTTSACAASDLNNPNSILDPSLYSSSNGLVCERCFSNGSPMAIVTNPTDGKEYVRFCDSTSSNRYRDELLIGSTDITEGYLLEEGANQDLYKQCFESGGIYTAIGCVDPTPTGIITGLIRISLGIMGGVALLQLVYVGILYQQGNSEKIKGARSQLIATLTGIAVLVFSVLILRIIGVNILDVVPSGSF